MHYQDLRTGLLLALAMALACTGLAHASEGEDPMRAHGEGSWSLVKSLYRDSAPATVEPELPVFPQPDGRVLNMVELLREMRAHRPDMKVWKLPELRALLDGERGIYDEIWKWVIDNLKYVLYLYALDLQIADTAGWSYVCNFDWLLGHDLPPCDCP